MHNKNITELIKKLLARHISLRDCDRTLTTVIWQMEASENCHTFIDFLDLYQLGKITPADTITRMRRKVQEEYPELRGKLWARRKEATKVVQDQLGYGKQFIPQPKNQQRLFENGRSFQ